MRKNADGCRCVLTVANLSLSLSLSLSLYVCTCASISLRGQLSAHKEYLKTLEATKVFPSPFFFSCTVGSSSRSHHILVPLYSARARSLSLSRSRSLFSLSLALSSLSLSL